MSNIIHSFRGYTSFVYRLIFIGIFPPALFILTWFFTDPAYLSWSWVIVFFYITYESIGDYMVFAGICNKENNNYVFFENLLSGGNDVSSGCSGRSDTAFRSCGCYGEYSVVPGSEWIGLHFDRNDLWSGAGHRQCDKIL